MPNFKAVIFDMDGVLIDSESHWQNIEKGLFANLGITLNHDIITQMTGKSMQESILLIKEHFGLLQSVEELLEQKKNASEEIYTKLSTPMPGIDQLLADIKHGGLPMAIASGSYLYRIEKIVKRFGWEKYFDQLVSTDHVGLKGKPDPAIYLYAAKTLNLDPHDCVVLEDSENGIRSAQAAGMKCIAVPDVRWSYGDVSIADLQAKNFMDRSIYDYLGI